MSEITKGPDNSFVASDLDDLGIVGAGVTIAEDDIASGEDLQSRDPGKLNARQIILLEMPDNLLGRSDLNHPVAIACTDKGVAVGESNRSEDGIAPCFGSMTAAWLLVE